jgi:DNA-binding beta-propeller fold protein YncE
MAFDGNGTLYVLDTDVDVLFTIDPSDASILDSVAIASSFGNGAGLAFHPTTGTLYLVDGGTGGTDELYTLDPGTGDLQEVGPLGLEDGLSGLTFLEPPPFFADGFESGNLSRWSDVVP